MIVPKSDIADPILYRLYFGFMLPSICKSKGLPVTDYVKKRLHDIHKKALKYDSIAGKPHETVSLFLFEVCALWACFGIFVRTKEEQPIGIENMDLHDVWGLL